MNNKKEAIVIGVINQKGGVGKTSTSNTLAYEFAVKMGLKTLLIDFDPQASQTKWLNREPREFTGQSKHNINRIFSKEVPEAIMITENLDFVPANLDLSKSSELSIPGKDKMLERYVKTIKEGYDVILIDSNPSFSTLMSNVILASDRILMPVGTSSLDEAGTHGFIDIVEDIAETYEKEHSFFFVLPTRFSRNRKDDNEVLAIYNNVVPQYISKKPTIGKSKVVVLPPVPEKAVMKDAAAYRMFLRSYIEQHARAQREMLLTFETISRELLQ